MDTEFSDIEPCGCDSGLPYAGCCKGKIARYVRDEKGAIYRQFLLSPEAVEVIKRAEEQIRFIFGRKAGRRDRVFLEFYRYSQEDIDRDFEFAADRAGVPKDLIYARRKTGLMLTGRTFEDAPPRDKEEWISALEEYRAAEADGIDLLEPGWTPILVALQVAKTQIEHSVIHFGSYADRAPTSVRTLLPLFLQFLMVARCHALLKALADGLARGMADEAYALLRSIYECSLLVGRLEAEPAYADALIAQALVGTSLYQYRVRNDGRTDYSRIVSSDGRSTHAGKTSYFDCAMSLGGAHVEVFEILYPLLSSHIHFDTVSMIGAYQDTGSFLTFSDPDAVKQCTLALLVISYAAGMAFRMGQAPRVLCRDADFLRKRMRRAYGFVLKAIEEEGLGIAPIYEELRETLDRVIWKSQPVA